MDEQNWDPIETPPESGGTATMDKAPPRYLSEFSDEQLQAALQKNSTPDRIPGKDADLSKFTDEQLRDALSAYKGIHEQQLAPVRQKIEQEGAGVSEGSLAYLGRQAIGAIRTPLTQAAYGYSKSRLNKGIADEGDLRNIAIFEREQAINQKQTGATQVAGVVANAPGEIATLIANPWLTAAKIGGGSIASKAAEEGKAPWDPEVVAKGTVNAAAMLGVMKVVGPLANKVFPGARESLVGRMGTEAAAFPVASAASEAATYAAGINTRYGKLQDFAEGKYGEFGLHVFGEFLLGAGLAAAHGGPQAGKAYADKFAEALDANAKKGFSVTEAARRAAETVKQAPETAPKPEIAQNAPESTVPPKAPLVAEAPADAATVAKTGVEPGSGERQLTGTGGQAGGGGLGGPGNGAGNAIVQNLYGGLFRALQGEKNAFSKMNDPALVKARPAYEKGLIKSPEDLQKLANNEWDPVKAGLERRGASVRVEKADQNGRHAILDAEGKDIGGIRVVERGETLYVSEAAGDVGTGNWKGILRALGDQHPNAKQLEWIRTTGPNAGKKQTIPLGKAARGSGDAADAIRSAFPEAFTEKTGPDPVQLKDLASFLGVKGATLDEIQNANANRLLKRGLSPEAAKQATLRSTEAFFKALEPQPAPTPEAFDAKQAAKELIAAVDDGGLPTFISNRMKKIAGELGVEIKGSDTAKDVVERIRDAVAEKPKPSLKERIKAKQAEQGTIAARPDAKAGRKVEPVLDLDATKTAPGKSADPLSPDERSFIDARTAGKTLKQLGQERGVSKQRAKQIEQEINKKLGTSEAVAAEHARQRLEAADTLSKKARGVEFGDPIERSGKEIPKTEKEVAYDKQVDEAIKQLQRDGHSASRVQKAARSSEQSGVREADQAADRAAEAGLDLAEWSARAEQIRQLANEAIAPHNQLVSDAYEALKRYGVSPKKLHTVRGKGGDANQLKGFDEVAQQIARQYPELMGDGESTHFGDRLFELLSEGKKKSMTVKEAHAKAVEEMSHEKADRDAADAEREAERPSVWDTAATTAHEQLSERVYGMGAAGINELLPDGAGPKRGNTALANARIDAERAAEGLNPILNSARMQNAEAWDAAMTRLEADPLAAKNLIVSLDKTPRALDVVEQAMLLREKIRLDNEYRVLAKQFAKSEMLDRVELERRIEELGRDRTDLATAVRRTGTELGRSLQFRRQLAKDDFSLQGLLGEFRAGFGREPTAEEFAKLAEQAARIEELQKKVAELEEQGKAKPGGPSDPGFEIEQIKKKFRREVGEGKLARGPWQQKAFRVAWDVLNIPRSIMASIDFPWLRQGMVAQLSHPIRTAKGIPEMIRSFFSQSVADRAQYEVEHRENAKLYKDAGLEITTTDGNLNQREEGFMSRLFDRTISERPSAAGKIGAALTSPFRGSARAYQTALNRIRADSFDALAQTLSKDGKLSSGEAKLIANYVNVMSGRGNLGKFDNAAPLLAQAFFAPKWTWSRFQFLTGQPLRQNLGEGSFRVRKEIAKEYGRMVAGMGVALGLASLAGSQLESDSGSPDFGKMKMNKTRGDLTGGLSNMAVFLSRFAWAEKKNPITGKIDSLQDKGKFGQDTVDKATWRFIRGKLAPIPGAIIDARTGSNVVGEPVTPLQAAGRTVSPIFIRDVTEAMTDLGLPKGIAVGLLGLMGMSIQTYTPRKKFESAGK